MQAEETYITVTLGEQGVGKTHNNIIAAKIYSRDNLKTGKKARKVLILNFQNEDGYDSFKTLPPTREAIIKFVNQKTIEVRQITNVNLDGTIMSNKQKIEVMNLVCNFFRNGLAIFEDVDGYSAYGSSGDRDLIGNLIGVRHKGNHYIFSHQAWRKMGVTEVENLRYIRLHKSKDSPLSLPPDKLVNLEIHLCMIAHYLVEMQYDLATTLYEQGKITELQWKQAKGYHVYIDNSKKRLFAGQGSVISDKNFELAVRRYANRSKNVLEEEVIEMAFEGICTRSQKNNPEIQRIAIDRLIKKFKYKYLKP